jgi:16S rRNA (cytosine1402-N4)-methyltransferase
VAGAVKTREPGQNPATRTFQAFRIFINAELEELQQALEASLSVLQPWRAAGGDQLSFAGRPHRQAVHRAAFQGGVTTAARRLPRPSHEAQVALDRIKPSAAEVAANPRSRSAIMRVQSARWRTARRWRGRAGASRA